MGTHSVSAAFSTAVVKHDSHDVADKPEYSAGPIYLSNNRVPLESGNEDLLEKRCSLRITLST